jgi:hypothetical protein
MKHMSVILFFCGSFFGFGQSLDEYLIKESVLHITTKLFNMPKRATHTQKGYWDA